jgi:hypothetical protein
MKRKPIIAAVAALLVTSVPATAQTGTQKPDFDAIAEKVVQQSLAVQPGEVVVITGGPAQIELMGALQVAVSKAGGQPLLQLNLPDANKRAIMETPMKHLKRLPTAALHMQRLADAFINVSSVDDPALFADVPEERMAATRQAGVPLNDAFRTARFRSVALGQTGGIPTAAYAATQGADHKAMTQMFWRALDVAPDRIAKDAQGIAAKFTAGTEVHLTSQAGTDLRFTVGSFKSRINAGRTGDVVQPSGPAQVWLPAGEAYACVDGNSATGRKVSGEPPHDLPGGSGHGSVSGHQRRHDSGIPRRVEPECQAPVPVRCRGESQQPADRRLSVSVVGDGGHGHRGDWEQCVGRGGQRLRCGAELPHRWTIVRDGQL